MARLSASQIKSLWLEAGGDPSKATLMTAIALAESREGDPNAVNPGVGHGGVHTNEYSVGLWQINTLVHKNYTVEQLKDPHINALEAVRIYRAQGLRAWGSYTDGRYRQYMSAAGADAGDITDIVPDPDSPALGDAGTWLIYGLGFVLFYLVVIDD